MKFFETTFQYQQEKSKLLAVKRRETTTTNNNEKEVNSHDSHYYELPAYSKETCYSQHYQDDCFTQKFLESDNARSRSFADSASHSMQLISSNNEAPSHTDDFLDVDSELQLPDYLCDLPAEEDNDNHAMIQQEDLKLSFNHQINKPSNIFNQNNNSSIAAYSQTKKQLKQKTSVHPNSFHKNSTQWIQCVEMKSQRQTIEVSYNSFECLEVIKPIQCDPIIEQNDSQIQMEECQQLKFPLEQANEKISVIFDDSEIEETAEKIACDKNILLTAFCEQVHSSNQIVMESLTSSVFAVSNYYSISSQEHADSSEKCASRKKSYYSIPFVEFLENQTCIDSTSARPDPVFPPRRQKKHVIPLHALINHFKGLIEDSPKTIKGILRMNSREQQQMQTNYNDQMVTAIVNDVSQFSLGQIVNQESVDLVTADGLSVVALCIWQVFPIASDNVIEGILMKQTWVIENALEITQARMKLDQQQTRASRRGNQGVLTLQEQADELDANNLAHSPLTSAVISFLRTFEYINKQKRIKKVNRLQDKFPQLTCKYRYIPKSKQNQQKQQVEQLSLFGNGIDIHSVNSDVTSINNDQL